MRKRSIQHCQRTNDTNNVGFPFTFLALQSLASDISGSNLFILWLDVLRLFPQDLISTCFLIRKKFLGVYNFKSRPSLCFLA